MAIADDFSVAVNGDIRYTGSTANHTVIDFHRWLGDLMDDAEASGDDLADITSATSTERSTDNFITLINGYNIDDAAAQHLYDGSVVQSAGAEIYDGILVFAAQGMYLELVQDGALVTNFWTTALNADAANGISHRFMVKTRTAGADIDGRRLLGQTREFGFTYSEFPINGTSRGNNVLALTYADDLNNATAEGTVSGWTTITNTEGYRLIDVDNDTVDEPYYSEWNRDTYTINQLYERMKWLTRRGTISTIYGVNGELFRGVTTEIVVDTITSGPLSAVEELTWTEATVVSAGTMVAVDSVSAPTKLWLQLTKGIKPTDGTTLTGTTSGATVDVNTTVTDRTISVPFCGQSTGTALIGAYGFGVEAADLSSIDKITDLDAQLNTPPNNVTFTISGVVSGQDRILIGPENAGDLDEGQFALSTAVTGASTDVILKVGTEIPGTGTDSAVDTPSTGTIRLQGDDGIYYRVTYTGYTVQASTMTFTGCANVPIASIDQNGYISYIDLIATSTSENFTVVYAADRGLFIRVRDGGASPIKTFETTGTLGSSGGSSTAIRTPDA